MAMHNPPHPGEFIDSTFLQPYGVSHRKVSELLDVSPSTFNRLVKGQSSISPEMALRLSKTLGRSPESWLQMQYNHDLWKARRQVKLGRVKKLNISDAA
jgi:addiction module HigA family antidote